MSNNKLMYLCKYFIITLLDVYHTNCNIKCNTNNRARQISNISVNINLVLQHFLSKICISYQRDVPLKAEPCK